MANQTRRDRAKGWAKEIGIAVAVFGAVYLVAGQLQLARQRGGGGALPVGSAAPPFRLTDVTTRETVDLQQLRGKPVILKFWATWCGVCREELDSVNAVAAEAGGRYHLVSIAQDAPAKLARLIAQRRLVFPVLLDGSGRVHRAYKVDSLPTTVIIDAQGQVVHDFAGAADEGVLGEHMAALLE